MTRLQALEAELAAEREQHAITQTLLGSELKRTERLQREANLLSGHESWRALALLQSQRLTDLSNMSVDVDLAIAAHQTLCGCPTFEKGKKK